MLLWLKELHIFHSVSAGVAAFTPGLREAWKFEKKKGGILSKTHKPSPLTPHSWSLIMVPCSLPKTVAKGRVPLNINGQGFTWPLHQFRTGGSPTFWGLLDFSAASCSWDLDNLHPTPAPLRGPGAAHCQCTLQCWDFLISAKGNEAKLDIRLSVSLARDLP